MMYNLMLYHKFEVLRGFFAFLLPKARLRQTQRRCSAFASPRRFRQTNLLQTQRRCSAFASPRLADFVRRSSARRSADMEQWLSQMDKWLRQIEQWVRQQPAEQLYVAAAVVIIASTLLILLRSFNRSKANTIIIAGLSGSGKTTLFYQLRGGSSHLGTVTSMEPNDDMFVLHSELEKKDKMKPVRVVDVPGHSRLRPKLDEYLPQAAGLIFVVDALDFLSNCRMAAEYLYDILTKATIVKKKIPVIILCNKTDKVTAHSKEFIKKQLEKEIDKLRASRTTISAADVTNEYSLGKSGEPFSFSHCLNQISVAEASALTGELTQAEHFIREHAKP